MKSLRAFWHWVDNEKPDAVPYKALETLSTVAYRSLDLAVELTCERIDYDFGSTDLNELHAFWPAIRDLSVSICAALEKMHEAVPKLDDDAMAILHEMYPPERVAADEAMADRVTGTLERHGFVDRGDGWHEPKPGDKGDVPVQAPAWMQDGLKLFRPADEYEREHARITAQHYQQQLAAQHSYMGELSKRINQQAALGGGVVQLPPVVKYLAPPVPHERDPYCRKDELHITPAMVVTGFDCDKLRGWCADVIHLHGKRADYREDVLVYLTQDVIGPMRVDGARVLYTDPAFREFFG